MKYTSFFLAASILLLAACSSLNEIDSEDTNILDEGELVEHVIFETPVIRSLGEDGETKASLTQEGDGNIRFGWESTDTVGIYPNKGSQVYFEMTNGVGTNSASFDGGGWSLRQGFIYSCYYPFVGDIYLDRNAIPVSFVNQEQTGLSNYDGIRFYLASEGTSSSSGTLRFTFQMLNTVIRVKAIGLPAGTYTKVSLTTDDPLFAQDGTFGLEDMTITGKTYSNTLEVSLTDFTLTEASTEVNPALIYFTSAPVDLSGKAVTVRVFSENGGIYKCIKTPSTSYEAGTWGGLKCTMEMESQPNNVIYYTSSDGEVVTPYDPGVFGANIVSNEYSGGVGIISFDGNVVSIGDSAFYGCTNLTSINLGTSISSIGSYAFYGCTSLSVIEIPDSILSIGDKAFSDCKTIMIGANVSSISSTAFSPSNIQSLVVSADNETYDSRDNCNALIETASNTLLCGGRNSVIPEGIEVIGEEAFLDSGMETIVIPSSVVLIKERAFSLYNVFKTVYCYANTPPTLEFMTFPNYWHPFYTSFMWSYTTTIFVPSNSYQDYVNEWGNLNSIKIEKMELIPEAVDLGLSSGIKWASFNIGASTPEGYGDYYAWGETGTYYSSENPLIWKNGKENGYAWASYFDNPSGDGNTFVKYTTNEKCTLDQEDDVAHVKLGGSWRMPTDAEWTELMNNCTWTWTTQNDVNGRLVTAANGNSIFLPAAGCWGDTGPVNAGSFGYYWSSSLYADGPNGAYSVGFGSNYVYMYANRYRYGGFPVRPVSE
jgi:hypothetical protein